MPCGATVAMPTGARSRRGIPGQVRDHRGVAGVIARILQQQRVSVRHGPHNRLNGDVAIGAGAVLDDDGLAEQPRQAVLKQASGEIGAAAGRVGHDDGNGAAGWRLGEGRRTGHREAGGEECAAGEAGHGVSSVAALLPGPRWRVAGSAAAGTSSAMGRPRRRLIGCPHHGGLSGGGDRSPRWPPAIAASVGNRRSAHLPSCRGARPGGRARSNDGLRRRSSTRPEAWNTGSKRPVDVAACRACCATRKPGWERGPSRIGAGGDERRLRSSLAGVPTTAVHQFGRTPFALATCVAIASISGGERQS
jgi:hypothetical protein